MAALLPSIVPESFGRHFEETPYSSRGSACRLAALSSHSDYPTHPAYKTRRKTSRVSFTSTRSLPLDARSLNNENKEPSNLELSQSHDISTDRLSPKATSTPVIPNLASRERISDVAKHSRGEGAVRTDESASSKRTFTAAHDVSKTVDKQASGRKEPDVSADTNLNISLNREGQELGELASYQFGKWADSFRKRRDGMARVSMRAQKGNSGRNMNFHVPPLYNRTFPLRRARLRKSTSFSSSGFVETVKTASLSTTSLGLLPVSLKNNQFSNEKTNPGSLMSASNLRVSTDSDKYQHTSSLDESARLRAVRRRQILDELLATEEGYIADLKVLVDLFSTILTSMPSVSSKLRSSIHHNVMVILHLHDSFVSELHHSVRRHASSAIESVVDRKPKIRRHTKWHSLDYQTQQAEEGHPTATRKSFEVPRRSQTALHQVVNLLVAQGPEVAEVARIVKRLTLHFSAYDEYCSKYSIMINEISNSQRLNSGWPAYESGVEALARSMSTLDARAGDQRKGLTIGDLLIKPIQRLCRYPLLFADLLKHTPVIDCPIAHTKIESALRLLQDSVQTANKVMDDPVARERVQRIWLLRERLVFFQEQSAYQDQLCKLGHIRLCGVLHVAYQTRSRVRGEYMLCVLFCSHLLLARPSKIQDKFEVVAIISLIDSKVESTEDGKGLQCHNVLHSWKLIFESSNDLYEIILSACSPVEEEKWKKPLQEPSASTGTTLNLLQHSKWPSERTAMFLFDLKSLGPVYGHADSFVRRLSVQRAATVGTRSGTCQVIIRNTANPVEGEDSRSDAAYAINRSQSLLSTQRVVVLAPKRSERIRLEHYLSDVWTRDVLPFPGMIATRGGNILRASAGSLVRRLSRASMHGPFSRRSTSITVIPSRTSHEENQDARDDELLASTQSPPRVHEAHRRTQSNTENSHCIRNSEDQKQESRRMSTGAARIPRSDYHFGKGQRFRTTVDADEHGTCERLSVEEKFEGRKRRSNPLSLLKHISTDGVRHLLYSSKAS